jgi:hypothetical protein
MSQKLARTADGFKTPLANYQLNTGTTSASVTIPWAHRCVSIYARDADQRWNVNGDATFSTHFIKQDERINLRMPDNGSSAITFNGRINANSGTASIEITAYEEDS